MHDGPELDDLVRSEQVRAHYAQLPSMVVAQTLGALFTAWVLWKSVDREVLVAGCGAVLLLSAARLGLWRRYTSLAVEHRGARRWRAMAVAGALASGCLWGSAAPLLYPAHEPGYTEFLVALLTLLPIVPVPALAAYLPTFHAYFIPSLAPFIVTLALQRDRGEHFTALLLAMVMLAVLAFARRYSRNLAQAIRLRAQLAAKSEALQAAVDHKTRFIAAASHDLRQPVHAMGLFLEALRGVGDAGAIDALNHLETSQRSLRAMLGNMLDISRLDAKVVQPQLQPFAVGPLLRQLSEEFALQAAGKGLALRCRPGSAVVRTDPVLLERILRNLLGNAVKYTERGGVLLACRRCPGGVALQVHDTGIGIRPEDTRAIFDTFSRAGGRHDAEGLGLGLAIVRQSADLLGHRLQLRSVPGRGSMFGLVVPLAEGAAPVAVAAAARRVPPGVVAIVDDDEPVREATAVLLRQWGLQVLTGASFDQMSAAFAGAGLLPDLLLVDYRLAQGDAGGLRAMQRRIGRDVPIILVTGDTTPSRIREAYEAGHMLLHKPVDPPMLRACLGEALAANPATGP